MNRVEMDPRALTLCLGGVWAAGSGLARCPVDGHGKGRGDLNPSLSIGVGDRQPLLVHCHAGCSQVDVLQAIRRLPCNGQLPRNCSKQKRSRGSGPNDVSRVARAGRIWTRAQSITGSPAERYLGSRGIETVSPSLRYLSQSRHPKSQATLPCLVAMLQSINGQLTAVQRTFLTLKGEKAPVDPVRMSLGRLTGSTVQLAPADCDLGLAEGVETALSAQHIFGLPVWALCGARFHSAVLPEVVKRVTIFADHDEAGLVAAERGRDALMARGLQVSIARPQRPSSDWNDVLLVKAGAAYHD